jgi:DNA (cytosine-5)-methyltransferase 1
MGSLQDVATVRETIERQFVIIFEVSVLPAISLFSGVGGLDLGVTRAGFDIRVAVEYESDAASSLRQNQFDDRPDAVFERSIVGLSTTEILEHAGLRVGEPALVVGGPPCTPFSKSGYWLEYKRTGNDPNASLLDEFARVVVEAMPRAVLMENVWSLAYNNHNAVPLTRLTSRLAAAGYRVRWEVLNAADYGVPQLRKRMILYATLGAEPPQFPKPTHSGWTETKRRFDTSLIPYVTSRATIGDLEFRDDLAERDESVNGENGSLLRLIPPGDNYLFFTEKRGHPEPRFRWRSRYWTFLLKLDPDRPATTIQSQPGPYVGPFHWDNRRLRLLETKRLQTFPDDYRVVGAARRSWQHQLGNAIPPLLAEIVARPLEAWLRGEDVAKPGQLPPALR